ncbi:hypothetical protein FQR65_LT06565 [Abscondita terminalis]|nr:hypothetical protein FQR65_LT06565 [Abscondita terminalis]
MPQPSEEEKSPTIYSTVFEEENSLISQPHPQITTVKSQPWYCKYSPPYFILIISFFELVIFGVANKDISGSLRCDPNKRKQIWRFFTYMFLHSNLVHVVLNVFTQCLFAFILEQNKSSIRVGIVYLLSGVVGALTATCLRRDLVVGASAGVYALLISYLSRIILNFNSTKHKAWKCLAVLIIVASDVTYYFINSSYKPNLVTISEGAHIGGAVSGFLLGLILYKSYDKESTTRNKVIRVFALIVFSISVITLLIINFQLSSR